MKKTRKLIMFVLVTLITYIKRYSNVNQDNNSIFNHVVSCTQKKHALNQSHKGYKFLTLRLTNSNKATLD